MSIPIRGSTSNCFRANTYQPVHPGQNPNDREEAQQDLPTDAFTPPIVSGQIPSVTIVSNLFHISREEAEQLIREISIPRRVFTEGNEQTEAFLQRELRAALPTAQITAQPIDIAHRCFGIFEIIKYPLDFDQSYPQGIHNIIAHIPGRDTTRTLVIGAHFDSFGDGLHHEFAPGTDDNASGVAALLLIARHLSSIGTPPFNIELVGFNAGAVEHEEARGSQQYVMDLGTHTDSIIGIINLDTLGSSPEETQLVIRSDGPSQELSDSFVQTNRRGVFFTNLHQDRINQFDHPSDEIAWRDTNVPLIRFEEPYTLDADRQHLTVDDNYANPGTVVRTAQLILATIPNISRTPTHPSTRTPRFVYPQLSCVPTVERHDSFAQNGFVFNLSGFPPSARNNPIWDRITERLLIGTNRVHFNISIDSCMRNFSGAPDGSRNILLGFPSSEIIDTDPQAVATLIAHEYAHTLMRKEPRHFVALVDQSYDLGTFDLLSERTIGNFPRSGHLTLTPHEAFATATQAYLIHPRTFRRMITLLSSNNPPQNPFPNNPALNRVFPIIWATTPNRTALANNLLNIYNYLRNEIFNGREFQDDLY